jgi:error-prone DNA polymerase
MPAAVVDGPITLSSGTANGARRLAPPPPPSASARRIALWRLGIAAPAYGAGEDATQMALPLNLPDAPALAPVEEWDAMIADYATTGLTVHRHPLRLLRPGLKARGTVTSADLEGMRHGATVSIGGLVVARQRPGTAKGVVFLLIEDETGTVNVIVPPKVYERDRLTVRTEPLVLVEGTLERHAAAGGAINVLVKRLVPLDAADIRTERPAATVKDFSPLDERERQRILEEQPLVAVGGGGVEPAAPIPGAERTAALAAVASSGIVGAHRAADGGVARTGAWSDGVSAPRAAGTAGPGHGSGANEPAQAPNRAGGGGGGLSLAEDRQPTEDRPPGDSVPDEQGGRRDDERSEKPVREHGGSEDFRAVAPPVMSFAQGRRR